MTHPKPTSAPSMSSAASQPLVRMRDVGKTFDHGAGQFHVLRRLSFDIQAGEFVSIMGPSGAGKSTLLHVLGLQDMDWTGEYALGDVEVHRLGAKERARLRNEQIGFVFQNYHLLDDLTVAENLEVPLGYRNLARSEREALVAESLDRFQLSGRQKLYPRQLSGGQQQLVGLVRALIGKPTLLLADEPTGNLHSDQAREIMRMFRDLHAAGTTIVQVTHSEENASYGTRVLRMSDGWLEDGGL